MNELPESVMIHRSPLGYYTVTVNGRFYGNYDTVSEAVKDLKSAEL